jgi:hypothetical protein
MYIVKSTEIESTGGFKQCCQNFDTVISIC